MNNDGYRFWYFENELDVLIYNIFGPLSLSQEEVTIDLAKQIEYAYAYEVSNKCLHVREGLSSLQVLQKMLNVEQYPIDLKNSKITRHEWYRITYDLIHHRISSLRDYAFHLINSVLELGLVPLQLKSKILKKRLKEDDKLSMMIDEISKAGENYRKDRNRLTHEGIFAGVDHEDLEMYKRFAMFEETLRVTPEEAKDQYISEYESRFKSMIENLIPEADKLNTLLNKLGDYLADEFLYRFNSKCSKEF